MKQPILYCLLAILLLGCDKSKEADPPQLGAYAANYMVHTDQGVFSFIFKGYTFEYTNGRIVKRTGGMACILSGTCQEEPTIIDDLTYDNNAIRITNRSGNDMSIRRKEWQFGLQNLKQPAYLLHKLENTKLYDSLAYTYHPNGKVRQIEIYLVYRDESEVAASKKRTKDFFFNTQGNLEKVETRTLLDDGFVLRIKVEQFENYDTAVNPFKGLFMFEDTYYRSLSENNFRRYRSEERDTQNGTVSAAQNKDWVLEYDLAGRPMFDKL